MPFHFHWNLKFRLFLLLSSINQFIYSKIITTHPLFINTFNNTSTITGIHRLGLIFEGNDRHDHLRHLYINRDKIFKDPEVVQHLKNYFGLTLENLEEHVIATMEEQIRDRDKTRNEPPIWVDAKIFKGTPEKFKLPLNPKLSLIKGDGIQDIKEVEEQDFLSEFDKKVYRILEIANLQHIKQSTQSDLDKFIELYIKVGSFEYEIIDNELYFYTDYQPLKRIKVTDQHLKRAKQIELMSRPTKNPSFIDPIDPHARTGRQRALQRKRDSGKLQKLRWKMHVPPQNDIPRGKSLQGNQLIQKFVDSMDFERVMSTAQDTNYFKNNFLETGHVITDRTTDNYFDIQFIGTPDAYPAAKEPDMTFTWPLYWIPWLSKKHPKRRGQPIKSPVFNLGGIEPLQLWFYPEGTAMSKPGFCSMKLITPPGWNLPYRIYLYIFSEYNKVVSKLMYKESLDYVAFTLNSTKLLCKKGIDELLESPKDNDGYVILGPAGNVYAGVGIADEPLPETDFRGAKRNHEKCKYNYDWNDGQYHMHKWFLKQTANPEDQEILDKYPKHYTHSLEYQPFKYYYTP